MTGSKTTASAAEAIAVDVRSRLVNLELYPGTQLKEAELAEHYAAGRHTVRAALAKLADEGLVEHDRHRGARVRQFTVADLDDTFDLREALEVAAARIICRRGGDLTALRDAVRHLEACERAEVADPGRGPEWETLRADRQAHQAIIDASGSKRIMRAYRTIATEIEYCYALYRHSTLPPDDHEHDAIAQALEARDERRAVALITRHVDDARRDLSAAMPGRQFP